MKEGTNMDEWRTVALIIRVSDDSMQDFLELIERIPGTQLVYKTMSKERLYISTEDPRRGRR